MCRVRSIHLPDVIFTLAVQWLYLSAARAYHRFVMSAMAIRWPVSGCRVRVMKLLEFVELLELKLNEPNEPEKPKVPAVSNIMI